MDGRHGGGEGSVERVVEDRGADVRHDNIQQWLTQILLFCGHWRRRGRRLEPQKKMLMLICALRRTHIQTQPLIRFLRLFCIFLRFQRACGCTLSSELK